MVSAVGEGADDAGVVGAVIGLLSRENMCSNLQCVHDDVRRMIYKRRGAERRASVATLRPNLPVFLRALGLRS